MGTNKTTKYDQIRTYLLEGNSITSLEAFTLFHSTRLSAVIFKLKNRDHIDIESETVRTPEGITYSRYWVSKQFLEQSKQVDEHAES